MKYKLFRIRSGKQERWTRWCYSLSHEYRDDAIRTLKEEQNTREVVIRMGEFVLYGMQGKFLPASACELNRTHFENLRECLEPVDAEIFARESGNEMLLDIAADGF